MEADIVAEGFRQAESMHVIRYMKVVGDGDNSVMSTVAIIMHSSTGTTNCCKKSFGMVPIMLTTIMNAATQPFAKLHRRNINVPLHHQMPVSATIGSSSSQPSTSNVIVIVNSSHA